jgi:NAD(P)-dependent dehydrogenase (short-subunit alcohol dehydrogenase family)
MPKGRWYERGADAGEPGVSAETVDLTDEASIAALGDRLGTVDHVVSTASARARSRVADLDRDAIRLSFDTKVIGPLMLAKHLAPQMNKGGSFVLFSGVAAAKIAIGTLGVAITNAAADTLARSLPHRPDPAHRRRRAADLTTPARRQCCTDGRAGSRR